MLSFRKNRCQAQSRTKEKAGEQREIRKEVVHAPGLVVEITEAVADSDMFSAIEQITLSK